MKKVNLIVLITIFFCSLAKVNCRGGRGRGSGHSGSHSSSSGAHSSTSSGRSSSSSGYSGSSSNSGSSGHSNSGIGDSIGDSSSKSIGYSGSSDYGSKRNNHWNRHKSSSSSDDYAAAYNPTPYNPPPYHPPPYDPPPYSSLSNVPDHGIHIPHTYNYRTTDLNRLSSSDHLSEKILGKDLFHLLNMSPKQEFYKQHNIGHRLPYENDDYNRPNSYDNSYKPPVVDIPPEEKFTLEEPLTKNDNLLDIVESYNVFHKKLYNTENSLHKTNPILTALGEEEMKHTSNARGNHKSKIDPDCKEIRTKQLNKNDEILITDDIREKCNQVPITASDATLKPIKIPALPPLLYALKEKRYEPMTTSTPRGINCRYVMNSELNERGDIIDTVTEVCDPSPTTTTTTRKPTIKTTSKPTTTTQPPMIKECRPHMNSVLSDDGVIIDTVTDVCIWKPAAKNTWDLKSFKRN